MRAQLLMLSLMACDEPLAAPPPDPPPPVVALSAPPVVPLTSTGLIEDERNTISIFETAAPATVFVTQKQQVSDWSTRRMVEVESGTGSGFLWDTEGHVVTNYHVLDGGRSFEVRFQDQRSYTATYVGGDPRKDIAVLLIEADDAPLTPISLPPRGAPLLVGQKTIAIGNPFGLDHTLTTGVISALGREVVGYGGVTIKDMIQTDASINPGNSGGPLLNSQGELIGMNTMIYSETGSSAGIGFAVPVKTIRRIVAQIIENGRVTQVGIGVTLVDDSRAARAGLQGVVIERVLEGSPAAEAGLTGLQQVGRRSMPGDIITAIDGTAVSSYDNLYTALDERKPGDVVRFSVVRDGEVREAEVTLYELP
ncbi:MAG: S1-C subfamily serine protease [Myxococcota bacterium]|jgi:S1-C subfamily serine protease